MLRLIIGIMTITGLIFLSCGKKKENLTEPQPQNTEQKSSTDYDPHRGEGKFNPENISLNSTLDKTMAASGKEIAGVKCVSCHKTSDEKLVGPGWKGVTQRREPSWILNFITNPDPMITKDPELQAQLELCLVRMPNQNLNESDARNILEYMREIDGVK